MKTGKFLTILGGLALGISAAQAQVSTNLISETTFDPAAPSGGTYGYYYGASGTYTIPDPYFAPEDTTQTNQLRRFNFDATGLDGLNNWGAGTGGSLFRADADPALFVSGDRADYIFTFNARAEGLLAGQTANGEMQAQIHLPDADGISKTFQVNLNFHPTAAWQTFRFSLQDGSIATGADKATVEDLAARHDQVTGLNFNVNFHEPFNAFGFDGDNALELDNVKLEVINRSSVPVQPTFTKSIIDWNLDDKGIWYSYPYDWSATDIKAAFTVTHQNNALGKDGTAGWALQMDNSAFASAPPAWAGGGTGGGGPGDYSLFDSGDLADYRVTFDARAEGLVSPTTAALLQIFVAAPDDTLQPADDNTDTDTLTQLNFPIPGLTTEWKNYSILFSKASVGGGSKENFANLFNKVSELRTQWQIENAASINDWGFDADNAIVVDNIKIERVFTGLQPFTFAVEGNELVLTWTPAATGTTKLQAAATVDGLFEDVESVEATYRTSTASGNRFFRLAWTP